MRITSISLSLFLGISLATFAQAKLDLLQPQLRIDPQGHSGLVNGLQFMADGKTLISVSADKTIRFWDVQSGLLNRTLRTESGIGPIGAIYTVSLSPDGQYLAIGGYFPENEIRIINIKRDKEIVILRGHQNVITKLVFSKNGRLLASASADRTVKLWQMSFNEGNIEGKLITSLKGHEGQVYDLDISPDGKQIISASADGTLRLWDITGVNKPVVMQMHIDKVYSCVFSNDGKYIISGGNKGKVIAWNSNGTFNSIMGSMGSAVGHLNCTSDNKIIASAKDIKVFSIPSGTLLGIIPKQDKNVNASAIFGNKYFASSASTTGKIIIRDLENQSTVSEIKGSGILPLEVATNNKGIVAIGYKSGGLSVAFDLLNLKFLFANFNKQSFSGANTNENGYSLTKVDQYTLSTGFKGMIKNNPAIDGRILRYTIINQNSIAVGSDHSIKIYSRDGELQKELVGANGAVTSMAVDTKNNYLITGTQDQTVRVWNVESGENLVSLFLADDNEWIAWTSKGYYSASAGGEKFLGWHMNKGTSKLSYFYQANVFSKTFHQPVVVKQAFKLGNEQEALAHLEVKERAITEDDMQLATAAPLIEWITPELIESDAERGRVAIKARIVSESKIKSVKILINGRPAPQSRGVDTNKSSMMVEQEIQLLNEINKIKIFVSNEQAKTVSEERIINLPKELINGRLVSNTQVIDFTAKPELYILGVGVSEYANPSYNLTYADDDAESITALFSTVGKGVYKQIHLEKLTNNDATKKKILNAFAWLHQNATSRDVVVIFIASHGFNENGDFYILPHDGDAKRLAETGISWQHLSSTLGNISAKVLLMVDACHSGQLGSDAGQNTSNNTEAVRKISADENGVVIMAASTGDETSLEFEGWGHGAFTLSILEGLEQGKADIKDDMIIFLRELDFYVSERTIELTKGQQHPTTQKPSSISRFRVLTIEND